MLYAVPTATASAVSVLLYVPDANFFQYKSQIYGYLPAVRKAGIPSYQ